MASKEKPYSFPKEHMAFLDEFQRLMKKHPTVAGRFVLADVGADPGVPVAGIRPSPVWECRRTDFGLVCKKVNPVM